jgi:hypothetical protein
VVFLEKDSESIASVYACCKTASCAGKYGGSCPLSPPMHSPASGRGLPQYSVEIHLLTITGDAILQSEGRRFKTFP